MIDKIQFCRSSKRKREHSTEQLIYFNGKEICKTVTAVSECVHCKYIEKSIAVKKRNRDFGSSPDGGAREYYHMEMRHKQRLLKDKILIIVVVGADVSPNARAHPRESLS